MNSSCFHLHLNRVLIIIEHVQLYFNPINYISLLITIEALAVLSTQQLFPFKLQPYSISYASERDDDGGIFLLPKVRIVRFRNLNLQQNVCYIVEYRVRKPVKKIRSFRIENSHD